MKRTFLIITTLLVFSVGASAKWFSVGASAGYSTTLNYGQKIGDIFNAKYNLQNGFNLGVYMRLGKRLYVQPEVLYNYTTYNNEITAAKAAPQNKRYVNSTFDIPVLVGYSFVNRPKFKLRVMAGPRFAFNAGSTKPQEFEEISQDMRTNRVGLDCGVGIDVWRFNLDVRYNLFEDLYKYKKDDIALESKPLHSFQVSLGFRIFGNNL